MKHPSESPVLDGVALEALARAARERRVPWGAERASRVQRNIARERSRRAAPAARFAIGGLATVALCASFVCVARAIHVDLPPEEGSAAVAGPWAPVPESEPADLDRPLGDGGFADSGE